MILNGPLALNLLLSLYPFGCLIGANGATRALEQHSFSGGFMASRIFVFIFLIAGHHTLSFAGEGRPPCTKELLRIQTSFVEGEILAAINKAASAYSKNSAALIVGFYVALSREKINVGEISKVDYRGALESLPPIYMFDISLTDGSVEQLRVSIPKQNQLSPDQLMSPVTPFQIDEAPKNEISLAVRRAASIYTQNEGQIERIFLAQLKSRNIDINDIESVEYTGAFESLPPQHQFRLKLKNGTTTGISVVAPM